jgi:adenylosuccinate lyase
LAFSQHVLLALVDRGLSRDEAYGIVQRAAAAAWDQGADFREALRSEPRVRETLSQPELDALFEPRLDHLDGVFARLQKLEVRPR